MKYKFEKKMFFVKQKYLKFSDVEVRCFKVSLILFFLILS